MATISNLRVGAGSCSYLTDAEVCEDLGRSAMWLNRARRGGDYPLPIKFTPNGRNNTPRSEHEAFKARHAAAPRALGRRPGGQHAPHLPTDETLIGKV
jgi:hypothetical protein